MVILKIGHAVVLGRSWNCEMFVADAGKINVLSNIATEPLT